MQQNVELYATHTTNLFFKFRIDIITLKFSITLKFPKALKFSIFSPAFSSICYTFLRQLGWAKQDLWGLGAES